MAKNRRPRTKESPTAGTARAGGAPPRPAATRASPGVGDSSPSRGHVRSASVATIRGKSRGPTSLLPLVGAVVVVAALLAGGIYLATRPASQDSLLGVLQPDEGRTHVPEGSPLQYKNNPPSSGSHYPSPASWGAYTDQDRVQPGFWVHNLEHGGVAVIYDCPSGCPDVVQIIQQAFTTFPKDKFGEVKLIATPYTGLPDGANVAAVAWDYVKLYHGDFTLRNLQAFYDGHVDRGPEDIP